MTESSYGPASSIATRPAQPAIGPGAEFDLAGIFDVKAGRNAGTGQRTVDAGRDGLVISSRLHDRLRGVRISAHGAAVSPGGLSFTVVVEPRSTCESPSSCSP